MISPVACLLLELARYGSCKRYGLAASVLCWGLMQGWGTHVGTLPFSTYWYLIFPYSVSIRKNVKFASSPAAVAASFKNKKSEDDICPS
jgi:hypothetical protein